MRRRFGAATTIVVWVILSGASSATAQMCPALPCGVLKWTALSAASVMTAATIPFTEEFAADASGWVDSGFAPLSWNATGGPDGGSFVSAAFNFFGFGAPFSPPQFRGEDDFDASGGSFKGNWISDGVTEFSVQVRHDAPFPVNWFVRFANPNNFPGAVAIKFIPVAPNTWTGISFAIDPANPEFVTFEGSDFSTVFSNIGHIHIGVDVTDSLRNLDQQILFAIDKPTIVPEPAGAILLLAGLTAVVPVRRRGRRTRHESA